ARAEAGPRLVCVPSFAGMSGPHQYARWSNAFHGTHDIAVLHQPGFTAGEPLPDSARAVTGLLAESVRDLSREPVVLVGYSGGGLVAHAVAAELARTGTPAAGLVLIDSYPPAGQDALAGFQTRLYQGLLDRLDSIAAAWGDDWPTAMARYSGFDWTPATLELPTLLVRASTPLTPVNGSWQPEWPTPVDQIDVPGTHFTLMEDDAPTTAAAIHAWLSRLGD
nr:alpha/beta fold hydrolase [Actinomycetota bacterium]